MYIKDAFFSNTGISQHRIVEELGNNVPVYTLYGQNELYEDLYGVEGKDSDRKQIRSSRRFDLLRNGDLIFSTISGEASIVSKEHEGYLFSQNYIRMELMNNSIDKRYIAFLINENAYIKKQFAQQLQGSKVIRYTLRLLKEIELPKLPPLIVQQIIGDIYFKELQLRALKQRVAERQCELNLTRLMEVSNNG